MSEGSQYIDIIFFAMVAAFLVLRLRSVLGRRTGEERQRPDPFTRPETTDDGRAERMDKTPVTLGVAEHGLVAGLARMRMADPSFDPGVFLGGARAAFEMILMAYAKGDRATLRPLLADAVHDNFCRAIDERERRGETMETELVDVRSVDFTDVVMDGTVALVTVRFVTEQVNVVRDADDTVIDGDPNQVEAVTDIWTFRRDMTSDDPNWELVATRVPEED